MRISEVLNEVRLTEESKDHIMQRHILQGSDFPEKSKFTITADEVFREIEDIIATAKRTNTVDYVEGDTVFLRRVYTKPIGINRTTKKPTDKCMYVVSSYRNNKPYIATAFPVDEQLYANGRMRQEIFKNQADSEERPQLYRGDEDEDDQDETGQFTGNVTDLEDWDNEPEDWDAEL